MSISSFIWQKILPLFRTHAGLALERRPLTGRVLARALLVHPLLTLRVHAAIYVQAGLLWLKRTPFFAHPGRGEPLSDTTT
jgi:DUF1365 family protein